MTEQVYVSWYGKVVAGEIINHNDMFGMTAVRIPIQGVQATVLYTPQHVYKTVQEACGDYPKHFPTPAEFKHPELPSTIGATIEKAIHDVRFFEKIPSKLLSQLHKFKEEHWDTEHNHLATDSLEEFYQLWREIIIMRQGMMHPKEPHQHTITIEAPATPEEAMKFRPQQKKNTIVTQLTLFT